MVLIMNLMKLVILSVAAILLSGCASNNVKSYRADYAAFLDFKNRTSCKINVKGVTMPEGDTNSILCRMAGNIYLPNKMTYSQYVNDALNKTLAVTEKLGSVGEAKHTVSVELTKVAFSSVSGEWYVDGNVTIDNRAPKHVMSVTKFGTSWDAMSACHNVAQGFDEAVTEFVKKVLDLI